MAKTDKIDDYLEIIETAKGGEEVRDAIIKALIVLDAAIFDMTNRAQYEEVVDEALDAIWNDVVYYFPNAIRPEHTFSPTEIISDELKSILKEIINSTTGTDIRLSIVNGLRYIFDNIESHNISVLYCCFGFLNIFDAFIDACDDEEKKELARSIHINNYENRIKTYQDSFYSRIQEHFNDIMDSKTGSAARPLIDSILNRLRNLVEVINFDTTGKDVPYLLSECYEHFENVARALVVGRVEWVEFIDCLYNVVDPVPVNTLEEARAKQAEVGALHTGCSWGCDRYFGDGKYWLMLSPDSSNDGWYLTYPAAYLRSLILMNLYPSLNLVPKRFPRRGGE